MENHFEGTEGFRNTAVSDRFTLSFKMLEDFMDCGQFV